MSATSGEVMARARRVRWLLLALGRALRFYANGAISDRTVLRRMVNEEYADFFPSTLWWFISERQKPDSPPIRPAVVLTSGDQLSPSMRKRKKAVTRATRIQALLTELDQQLIFFVNGTTEEKQTLKEWLVGWRIGRALCTLQTPWHEECMLEWRYFNQW